MSAALLDRLAAALSEERRALLDHDVTALVAANEEKLSALRGLEAHPPVDAGARVAELRELNQANGALLARRQREVRWALRHLGRSEASPAYTGRGQFASQTRARVLGCA